MYNASLRVDNQVNQGRSTQAKPKAVYARGRDREISASVLTGNGSVSYCTSSGPLDPNYGGGQVLQLLLPLNTHRVFEVLA